MQYEQYEQEVKNLQRLIEEAHRIIQDRHVSTNNIQELQAQIHHHEVRRHTLKLITNISMWTPELYSHTVCTYVCLNLENHFHIDLALSH